MRPILPLCQSDKKDHSRDKTHCGYNRGCNVQEFPCDIVRIRGIGVHGLAGMVYSKVAVSFRFFHWELLLCLMCLQYTGSSVQ